MLRSGARMSCVRSNLFWIVNLNLMLVHHATIWLQNYFVIENIQKNSKLSNFYGVRKTKLFLCWCKLFTSSVKMIWILGWTRDKGDKELQFGSLSHCNQQQEWCETQYIREETKTREAGGISSHNTERHWETEATEARLWQIQRCFY